MILICLCSPCCAAWRQNVAKSGGIGKVLMISTFSALNLAICAEKSVVPLSYGPASTMVKPAFCSCGSSAARIALPSASLGSSEPPFLLVGIDAHCAT